MKTLEKKLRTIPRLRGKARGFSLIEVTIALGVVSVAFIALLGVLPVGLNTFNESIDASTETQIGQSILTQARQSKFSEMDKLPTRIKLYFDDQGKPVDNKSKAIYYLNPTGGGADGPDIQLVFKKGLEVGDSLAASDGTVSEAALAIVRVTVRKISSPKEKSTVVAYIANNGL